MGDLFLIVIVFWNVMLSKIARNKKRQLKAQLAFYALYPSHSR